MPEDVLTFHGNVPSEEGSSPQSTRDGFGKWQVKSELRFNYTRTLQCLQADNRAIRLEMGISEHLRFFLLS